MSSAALYLHPKYCPGSKAVANSNRQPTLKILINGFEVCIFADEGDSEKLAAAATALNELFEYSPPVTESTPCAVDHDGYDLPF